ncbi:hypothetical protein Bca101_014676 [Brassica carinata]
MRFRRSCLLISDIDITPESGIFEFSLTSGTNLTTGETPGTSVLVEFLTCTWLVAGVVALSLTGDGFRLGRAAGGSALATGAVAFSFTRGNAAGGSELAAGAVAFSFT